MECCQLLQPEKVTGTFNDMQKNLNSVPSANGIMECLMLGSDVAKFVLRKTIKGSVEKGYENCKTFFRDDC